MEIFRFLIHNLKPDQKAEAKSAHKKQKFEVGSGLAGVDKQKEYTVKVLGYRIGIAKSGSEKHTRRKLVFHKLMDEIEHL